MNIVNQTGYSKIDEAIDYFYKVLPEVLDALSKLPASDKDFTYTEDTNGQVIYNINYNLRRDTYLFIKTYRPKYIFSKAIGYSNGTNTIYINGRKIDSLSYLDYAGNLTHEWLHTIGYTHGSNYIDSKKKKSVPYAIGYLVSGESSYPLVKEQTLEHELICHCNWWTLCLKKKCTVVGSI